MVISHSHRFIFIHIPKTAGSSVTRALAGFAEPPVQAWVHGLLRQVGIHVNYFGPVQWKQFRTHSTAAVLKRHLPEQVYSDFFKFAFVRNPWDRLVSSYYYLLNNRMHHRHRRVCSLRDFEEYVNYEAWRNKMSQTAFLVQPDGRLIVDFVGRFETLREDFAHVGRVLKLDVSLPHINRTLHRDYRSYYTDRTARLVAEYWREDIEMFGYTFDGPRRVRAS